MKEKRYDVFISHSSKDKKVAFTLCKALENEGLICWIAPRDVGIGHYASSIVEGVEENKIFVLILSKNSNSSTPVINIQIKKHDYLYDQNNPNFLINPLFLSFLRISFALFSFAGR